MKQFDNEILIERPLAEVFGFFADAGKLGTGIKGLSRMELVGGGEMQVGSKLREVRVVEGQEVESTVEVTQFSPLEVVALKSVRPPFWAEYQYRFESVAEGTRILFTATVGAEGVPEEMFNQVFAAIQQEDGEHLTLIRDAVLRTEA